MPYTEHDVVKAEALAATAAQVLEQNLTIPAIFDRENFDQYQGSLGDVVNVRVEGVLPFHNYGFRNDRTNEIIVDTYSERKITVGLADHFYQAVELTDEQKAKVKTLATEHGKNFGDNPKANRAAQKALDAKVAELLTEEQKAAMAKKPAKKKAAPAATE